MPTATLDTPPALDTTPTLVLECAGEHDTLFFRVALTSTLTRQIEQLQALLASAPADADVTSVIALARTNAALVTRYPRTTLDDAPSDPIYQRLTSLELDIDPDTGERHHTCPGYGGMTILPAHAYPDPHGIFDERSLVYLRVYAHSHEIALESWYGDAETVESRTLNPDLLKEHLASEAPA